jgi:F-type H+-transporting ATPase subunit delta
MAYAHSLLELANEQKQAEPIGAELNDLRKIVEDNPAAREMMSNPAIGVEERSKMLDRTFRNNVSPLLFNVLGVINQHNRLGLVAELAQAYRELLDKQLGKVEVEITVASALDSQMASNAQTKITAALGKEAVVHQKVDPSIIGGVIVRVGDKLIDASVRHQLEAMKQQMLAAAPK